MTTHDSDPKKPPLPSRNGLCGSQDPQETGSYPPAASWPPAATVPGGPSTGRERLDFLSSPQAAGELGWLAHYRVLRLLGEGGMGLVFLAEDSLLSRPVALKVIRPEIADTPGIAERFTREARATAAIKHDHIVTIYQVGQERGVPFLAMEYLKGMSLAHWLDRGHKPSLEVVLRIGREIAAGLSAAHRHSLVHRDIKPANIWLEAPSGRVKILDFGMARSQREDVEITRTGAVMGTPAYMAPEQAHGEPAGASSDLFSLGCVLYRLCTLRLPFEGDSVIAVLTSIWTETPRAPRDLNDTIPASLSDLIMRLLHKMPEARPVSAEVVVNELRSIERELLAARQNAGMRPAVPPMDAVGPGGRSPREFVGETSPTRLAPRPEARRRLLGVAAVLAVLVVAAIVSLVFAQSRRSNIALVAAEPTLAPDREPGTLGPAMLPNTNDPRPAQPAAGPDRPTAGLDRGEVLVPSALAGEDVPRSTAAIEPGLSPALPKVAQHQDQPPGLVAPSDRKTRNEPPTASIASNGPAPEGRDPAAREKKPWGDAVDPDGDCQFELDPGEDKVRIIVPGKTHILSAEIGRVNAPRLLRDIKGDFDLIVRVAGAGNPAGKATTTLYPPYHGAGLLIWQDQENYVRLEIATDVQHRKARPYVNFEHRKDGTLAASSGIANTDGSSHLRLRRRGDEIYASFGPDGLHWTSFSPLTAKLNDRVNVGVSAINSSTKLMTAEFEGLEALEIPEAARDPKAGGLHP
jgi:regulation of enolase protein 1 (concanavalin A-like superfamily)